MDKRKFIVPPPVISLLFLLFFSFFGGSALAKEGEKVFVSILPQKYFVDRLSGGLVEVEVMVMPGASPATYEPKPSQMKKLEASKAYFAIGVPFEKVWLNRLAEVNPEMAIVDTARGIDKLPMAAHHHHEDHGDAHHQGHKDHEDHGDAHHQGHKDHEDHGDAHHQEHGDHHHQDGLDPHIWLSPPLVAIQAKTIAEALTEIYPQHQEVLAANLQDFTNEIGSLDEQLRELLTDSRGGRFMIFHPSWGYFANQYGLKQMPIEMDGKQPKPAQLQELIDHAKEEGIKVIFAQPQFSAKSAKIVAREIDGSVLFIDPLALDWSENLLEVAKELQKALR